MEQWLSSQVGWSQVGWSQVGQRFALEERKQLQAHAVNVIPAASHDGKLLLGLTLSPKPGCEDGVGIKAVVLRPTANPTRARFALGWG